MRTSASPSSFFGLFFQDFKLKISKTSWIVAGSLLLVAIQASQACYYNLGNFCDGLPSGTVAFCGTDPAETSVFCRFPPDSSCQYDPNPCYDGCATTRVPLANYLTCPEGPPPPNYPPPQQPRDPKTGCGSVIRFDSQSVSDEIPLVGSPFKLVYVSDRVAGGPAYKTHIPVTTAAYTGDASVTAETIQLQIAGQTISHSYSPAPSITYDFTWDGKDNLGNPILGSQTLMVTLDETFVTAPAYPAPRTIRYALGVMKNEPIGLGGWDFSIHHQYDPGRKLLQRGDGSVYSVDNLSLTGGGYRVVGEGGSEVYIFDSNWRHTATLNGLLGTTKYTFNYNGSGNLSSIVDADGNTTSVNYTSGVISGITAPFGQSTAITVDGNGYLASVTNPHSEAYSMTYSSGGLLGTFEKPSGVTSTMLYDTDGRLVSDSSSAGSSTSISVVDDGTNRVISGVSAVGRNSVVSVTYPTNYSGTVSTPSYRRTSTDPNGNVDLLFSTPSTATTTYQGAFGDGSDSSTTDDIRFGSFLPFVSVADVYLGGYQKIISRSQSVVLNSTDPFDINTYTVNETVNSKTNSKVYTGSSKTFVTTSPVGRTRTEIIDSKERPTSYQLASLTPVTFGYDSYGRLNQVAQGVSRQTDLGYDATSGFLNAITDPLSHVWGFAYDAAGRVTTETLPDSRTIGFGYDSNGNVTSVTPPAGSTHSMGYNGFDLLGSYVGPIAFRAETRSMNWLRKATRSFAAKIRPHSEKLAEKVSYFTGPETDYTYNNDRQLTEISRPDSQTVTFAYNSTTGMLDSLTEAGGTNTFSYFLGLLQSSTSFDSVTRDITTSVRLMTADKLTYSSSGHNSTVNYTYGADHLKLNEQVVSDGTTSATNYAFAYDNDTLLTTAGDETITRSSTTGYPTQLAIGTNAKTLFAYSSGYGELSQIQGKYGSTVKYQEDLTRDNTGRISSRTEAYSGTSSSYGYTYDSAGRLTAMTLGGSAHSSYSYDSDSNRTSQTISGTTTAATYDGQDRLTTFGTKTYSYNAAGERTSVVDSGFSPSQTTSYTYDGFGNLKTVTLPSGSVITYTLDANGRRARKKTGSTVNAHYVYGANNELLAVLASNGTISMRFIYGSKPNVPDYMIKSSTKYLIVSNHLGSPVQVINTSNGAISEEIHYDEWGNITSDTSAGFQPFGFAGCLFDSDSKLCHFGSRDYDASVGRWLTKDPILFGGGDSNLYGYVLSDPINWIDPSGLSPLGEMGPSAPLPSANLPGPSPQGTPTPFTPTLPAPSSDNPEFPGSLPPVGKPPKFTPGHSGPGGGARGNSGPGGTGNPGSPGAPGGPGSSSSCG
jgi:RHS repeat-associated protein